MICNCKKRDTKQEILKESFLLCGESKSSNFSLSEVADRVGISKTAIFRHFKNKDALIVEMRHVFLDKFAELFKGENFFFSQIPLKKCEFKEFSLIVDRVLSFYMTNPGYLDFFLSMDTMHAGIGKSLVSAMKDRGVSISDEFIAKGHQIFFKAYFCAESIVYFLTRRNFAKLEKNPVGISDEEFKQKVINLLWNGIGNESFILSDKRKKELDELSKIELQDETESKFFKAFAEIFSEYGIEGVTVERISEKVNLAKSSLYSYFDNKDQFILEMFVQEVSTISNLIFEKTECVENIDELIYTVLRTEKNYLELKPFVLMIHSWVTQNKFDLDKTHVLGNAKFIENTREKIQKQIDEKYFDTVSSFFGWISSLSGALTIYLGTQKLQELSKKEDYADVIFNLVKGGVNTEKE
ncbi:TetR/AcrR family transcriptional regulator [Treponema sp.]|uniref:TetR/AcrR family transcriptional regulator n=1 Tax=Treponema sp. TaxID=166 RepID=UPI00388F4202